MRTSKVRMGTITVLRLRAGMQSNGSLKSGIVDILCALQAKPRFKRTAAPQLVSCNAAGTRLSCNLSCFLTQVRGHNSMESYMLRLSITELV